MTVCVAVRVHDSMVFAADSATTLEARNPSGQTAVVNVYQHGNKIFCLYKGLPVMAMTCGMGHIGDRAISSLAKDLRQRLISGTPEWRIDPENYTIEQIAKLAERFLFKERYASLNPAPPNPHLFEFWIGGYPAKSETHDLWKLTIENGKCSLDRLGPEGMVGIRWGGQPEAITRLIKGFSPNVEAALVANGMLPADAKKVDAFLKTHFEINLAQASMPVQDVIDLAEFLVETTKGFFRFKLGADTVGGDTDIAVVTRHEGFKWIKRKHYYDPGLNPLETDHAGERQRYDSSRVPAGSTQKPGNAGVRISDSSVRKSKRQQYKRPKRQS